MAMARQTARQAGARTAQKRADAMEKGGEGAAAAMQAKLKEAMIRGDADACCCCCCSGRNAAAHACTHSTMLRC